MPHFKGKAITLWRPWDQAILYHGKDVENRSWNTNYRGPLALHAGQKWDSEGVVFILRTITRYPVLGTFDGNLADLSAGKVVGVCELYDVQQFYRGCPLSSCNPWAFGPYCWLLRNIQPIKPVPMRGRQRLWNVEFDYEVR